MRCQLELSKRIEDFSKVGTERRMVEERLRSAGIGFTTYDRKDSVGRLPDGTSESGRFESRILVVVDAPRKSGQNPPLTESEVVTIGLDKESRVLEVACKKVFTGP